MREFLSRQAVWSSALLALAAAGCSLPLDRVLDLGADGALPDAITDHAADEAAAPDTTIDLADDTLPSYSWKTGDWDGCSAECGGGTQRRDVYCQRGDGQKVDEQHCIGERPSEQQDCNTQSCNITGENCDDCPYGYTQQAGPCLDKFACNLKANQIGRYYYEGAWHEGCAICNMGGGIKWEIEDK